MRCVMAFHPNGHGHRSSRAVLEDSSSTVTGEQAPSELHTLPTILPSCHLPHCLEENKPGEVNAQDPKVGQGSLPLWSPDPLTSALPTLHHEFSVCFSLITHAKK